MQVISSECVILRNRDFREGDRLVTFLARDRGRLSGIARGSRKTTARSVSAFEPCTRGTIFYVEKQGVELVTIRKCDPLPPYLLLTGDYDKILMGGYFAELAELAGISADDAPALYRLLCDGLQALCDAAGPLALGLARLRYELSYLACLGLQPDLARCGACGRELFQAHGATPQLAQRGEHGFDVARGVMRCPACHVPGDRALPLAAGSMAFLGAWLSAAEANPVRPTHLALVQIEAAICQHLVHHLERLPRSLNLLPKPGPSTGSKP